MDPTESRGPYLYHKRTKRAAALTAGRMLAVSQEHARCRQCLQTVQGTVGQCLAQSK